jgi:hypothetical protein
MEHKIKNGRINRKRRGVGAIIGGMLLVAILLTTLLVYFITILNNDERRALYDVESAQVDQKKAAETLTVTATKVEVDPLSPTGFSMKTLLSNEGSLPLVISHSAAYCIDCSSPNDPDPSTVNTPIPLNLKESANRDVPVSIGNNYTAGFITERGNIFFSDNCKIVSATELICTGDDGGSTAPFFEISGSPDVFWVQAGTTGEESTITVTSHNGFNSPVTISVESDPEVTWTLTPPAPVVTPPADGLDDTTILTISVADGVPAGNYYLTVRGDSSPLSDDTTITVVVFSTEDDDEELEDEDQILKPQISGVFPNPFGATGSSSSAQGLFGVVVANPSDAPMEVRRVLVSAFDPKGSSDVIFPKSSGSDICKDTGMTMIFPTSGWNCPENNILQWSSTSPQTINPHSAKFFFVTLGKNSGGNMPSLALNFNVFTDFGQFAKAGYAGSQQAHNAHAPIASVYLSTATQTTPTPSTMTGTRSGTSGNTMTVIANIANMGDSSAGYIRTGANLIISIPKAFTGVGSIAPGSGLGSCQNTLFDDGSSQISCPLTSDLLPGQARSVQFTMTAPIVTEEKLYPLFILADGLDSNDQPVGPVAENVVRVTPS